MEVKIAKKVKFILSNLNNNIEMNLTFKWNDIKMKSNVEPSISSYKLSTVKLEGDRGVKVKKMMLI